MFWPSPEELAASSIFGEMLSASQYHTPLTDPLSGAAMCIKTGQYIAKHFLHHERPHDLAKSKWNVPHLIGMLLSHSTTVRDFLPASR